MSFYIYFIWSIGLALTIGVIVIFTVDTGEIEVIPDEMRHLELSPSPDSSDPVKPTWRPDMSERRSHWMRPDPRERPMRPRPTKAPRPVIPAVPAADSNIADFSIKKFSDIDD